MLLDNDFIDTVVRIIKEYDINQAGLAKKIGIHKSHLCRILKRDMPMSDGVKNKLKDRLAIFLTTEQPAAH